MYGYGVWFDGANLTRVLDLVKMFPKDYADFSEWLKKEHNTLADKCAPDEAENYCEEWITEFED